MEIKNKTGLFSGGLWYIISFIVVSLAFILLDITDVIPSFVGTTMVIYGIILLLFFIAIYAKQRHDRKMKK